MDISEFWIYSTFSSSTVSGCVNLCGSGWSSIFGKSDQYNGNATPGGKIESFFFRSWSFSLLQRGACKLPTLSISNTIVFRALQTGQMQIILSYTAPPSANERPEILIASWISDASLFAARSIDLFIPCISTENWVEALGDCPWIDW